MNEYEKRLVDIAQRQQDLDAVLLAMGRNVLKEHFGYTVVLRGSPIAPNVNFTKMTSIQSDAWFVLHYISAGIINVATEQWFSDAGSMQIQITNTGSGQVLYSSPSSAGVLTSVANRAISGVPFLLPVPVLLPPNTNVKIDLSQFADTGASYEAAFVSLMGTRVAMI